MRGRALASRSVMFTFRFGEIERKNLHKFFGPMQCWLRSFISHAECIENIANNRNLASVLSALAIYGNWIGETKRKFEPEKMVTEIGNARRGPAGTGLGLRQSPRDRATPKCSGTHLPNGDNALLSLSSSAQRHYRIPRPQNK